MPRPTEVMNYDGYLEDMEEVQGCIHWGGRGAVW